MGCSPSSAKEFNPADYNHIWQNSNENLLPAAKKRSHQSGWKILRIVLISTFKDFWNERNYIMEVIEHLQSQYNRSKLHLQLEDFCSNQKNRYEESESVALLSHLIEEARRETEHVIYIHLIGNCIGYVIPEAFKDTALLRRYGIRPGYTLNEAALVMTGAKNPNALFLHRNSSFLSSLPFNDGTFVEEEIDRKRAEHFDATVRIKARGEHIDYTCQTAGINNRFNKKIVLINMEPMLKSVESFLIARCDSFATSKGREESTSEMLRRHFMNTTDKQLAHTAKEVASYCTKAGVILVHGDYGSGKTTILKLAQERVEEAVWIEGKDDWTWDNLRMKIARHEAGNESLVIIVDDCDVLPREVVSELLTMWSASATVLLSSRRNKLPKRGTEYTPVAAPAVSSTDAVRLLSIAMSAGAERKGSAMAERIVNEAKRLDDGKDVERGDRQVEWSRDKCCIIGRMVMLGTSEEQAKRLAAYNTLSSCETDISLAEAESRGHLVIAMLCFLSIVKTGLTEAELRYLLAPEDHILPIGIRRKARGLPFDYELDKYGSNGQVSAIRWRYAIRRAEHYLRRVDDDSNHFLLASVCDRVVRQRFLSSPSHLEHFKHRIQKLLDQMFPWCDGPRTDEISKFC